MSLLTCVLRAQVNVTMSLIIISKHAYVKMQNFLKIIIKRADFYGQT